MDSSLWHQLWQATLHPDIARVLRDTVVPAIWLGEKILRPVLVYMFLVGGLRLAGKRELAQLNPFDLVVLLTLSNTVQNAIIGEDNSVLGGMVGAATLLAMNAFVVRFFYKHPRLEALIEGKATSLIECGKIIQPALEAERLTLAELEAVAHKQGFHSLDEVESAALEPGGAVSFVGKDPSPSAARSRAILTELRQLRQEVATLRA